VYGSKDKVRVVIITNAYRMEGDLYILPGSRLTDALNVKAKDFFAMTDVKVYRIVDDALLWQPSYLAVNREAIACIFPVEAP
jgi:hypothetical protein